MTPESLEKSRLEFEVFLSKNFKMCNPAQNYKKDNGEYFYAHAELAWKAWKAGRQSLVDALRRSCLP